jgi:hypothetical protein
MLLLRALAGSKILAQLNFSLFLGFRLRESKCVQHFSAGWVANRVVNLAGNRLGVLVRAFAHAAWALSVRLFFPSAPDGSWA